MILGEGSPSILGTSFIELIPKKAGADTIKDFRPITLIRCIYKILAKVLTGKTQKILLGFMTHNQSAFVRGRQILIVLIAKNVFTLELETKDLACYVR